MSCGIALKAATRRVNSPGSTLPGVAVLFNCLLFLSASLELAQANPLKSPRRTVNQYVVDLSPLFQWWTNRAGPRPLQAWVHISGEIIATNAWGWVLHAHIEDSARVNRSPSPHSGKGTANIILENPPWADLAEFEALKARLKMLLAQRGAGATEVTAAQKSVKEVSELQKESRQHHSIRLARESTKRKELEKAAQDKIKQLDAEIALIRKKLSAFPNQEGYLVDCFALTQSVEVDGVAVYNHGTIFR
jgi:hypothetical protein